MTIEIINKMKRSDTKTMRSSFDAVLHQPDLIEPRVYQSSEKKLVNRVAKGLSLLTLNSKTPPKRGSTMKSLVRKPPETTLVNRRESQRDIIIR